VEILEAVAVAAGQVAAIFKRQPANFKHLGLKQVGQTALADSAIFQVGRSRQDLSLVYLWCLPV
jgi:hypothetical protein